MAELFHPDIIADSDCSNCSGYIIKNSFVLFFCFSLIFSPNPEHKLLYPHCCYFYIEYSFNTKHYKIAAHLTKFGC